MRSQRRTSTCPPASRSSTPRPTSRRWTRSTKLEVYLTIGRGRGYRPAEENKSADQPIGVIPIDSIFSPVRRVAYNVEQARVGQKTDFDKLTLDIETDGSIDPHAALREAAEILISQLAIFTDARPRRRAARHGGSGALDAGLRRRRRRRSGAHAERDGRHPDRGARARRPLLQLPQAGGHPDRRRPRRQDRGRAQRDPELRQEVDRRSHRDPARARPCARDDDGKLRGSRHAPSTPAISSSAAARRTASRC